MKTTRRTNAPSTLRIRMTKGDIAKAFAAIGCQHSRTCPVSQAFQRVLKVKPGSVATSWTSVTTPRGHFNLPRAAQLLIDSFDNAVVKIGLKSALINPITFTATRVTQ